MSKATTGLSCHAVGQMSRRMERPGLERMSMCADTWYTNRLHILSGGTPARLESMARR